MLTQLGKIDNADETMYLDMPSALAVQDTGQPPNKPQACFENQTWGSNYQLYSYETDVQLLGQSKIKKCGAH